MSSMTRVFLAVALAITVHGCGDESPPADVEQGAGGSPGGAGGSTSGAGGAIAPMGGTAVGMGGSPVGMGGAIAPMGGEMSGAGGEAMAPLPDGCRDPGRVTVRRLNRAEYDNTVRDLLQDETRPARGFPEDDLGYGFDNIGDVLSISALHIENYEATATQLIEAAMPIRTGAVEQVFEAEDLGSDVGALHQLNYWNLWSEGEITATVNLPADGEYELRVRAFGRQAGDELPILVMSLDGVEVQRFDVAATDEEPAWYTHRVDTTAGQHTFSVAFINDFFDPDAEDPSRRDRNLYIDVLAVDGPQGVAGGTVEHVFEAEEVGSNVGAASGDFWNLWSNGTIEVDFELPTAGDYEIRVRAFGQRAGPDLPQMAVVFDNQPPTVIDVEAERDSVEWYPVTVTAEPGLHVVQVSFLNDYYMPDAPDPADRDRNLHIDAIIIDGPHGNVVVPEEDAPRSPLFVCEPEGPNDLACAGEVVESFARRAWRRPVTGDEVERLLTLVQLALDEGDALEVGIQLALRAVLLSPHFIYRVELDPDPNSLVPHRLTDHELASRLSYFIWSSMPDEALFAAADAGQLHDEEILNAQVRRMLADDKAEAFVDNFAGQWLYIRAMTDAAPDYNYFPDFDEMLRAAMTIEAQLFFRHLLSNNRPLSELMDAEVTFLNPRLAEHYGIDYAQGREAEGLPAGFLEFDLAGTNRSGFLTMGSTLTVTSYPTRTSPVKRGKWVLEQLMCDGPPPPPPGVEAELADVDQELPLRERLAAHREDPSCSGCHNLMDPIGLGLESFDGIGSYREIEAGQPVDASGQLPNGTAFDGATELATILRDDPRFTTCFQEKLVVYGVGRDPNIRDACSMRIIEDKIAEDGWQMQDAIVHLTSSPLFTMRRGEEEAE